MSDEPRTEQSRKPRTPWNKGKLTGPKPPLKVREIWAIRIRLQLAEKLAQVILLGESGSVFQQDPGKLGFGYFGKEAITTQEHRTADMIFIQAVLVLMIKRDGFVFGKTIAMMALCGESHASILIIIESQTGTTSYCGQTSLLCAIGIQVL